MTSFVRDTSILAGRAWRLTKTMPVLIGVVVMPVIFLLGFRVVYGRLLTSVHVSPGQYLPPAVIVQASLLTAITAASSVMEDRTSRMLDRLRVMPVNTLAVPVARFGIEGVRAAVSALVVVAVGYAIGFRFGNPLQAIAFVVVAVVFAMVLSLGTGALAMVVPDPEALFSLLFLPYLPVMTLSSAFAPTSQFPGWLQPYVRVSPVSAVANLLRRLGAGTADAGVWLPVGAWLVGLGVLFGALAAAALRSVSR